MNATNAQIARKGGWPTKILLTVLVLASMAACSALLFSTAVSYAIPQSAKPNGDLQALQTMPKAELATLAEQETDRLIRAPLDSEATFRLATLQSLLGHNEQAEELAIEAATRSYHESRPQLAAVALLMAKKRYGESLGHMDALLRSKPALYPDLFKLIANAQNDPQFRNAFAQLLLREPPWRRSYVYETVITDQSGQGTFQLLSALRAAGGDLTLDELRHYIGRQISNKNFDLAYFIWLDSLDQSALIKVDNIFDYSFDLPPRNLFFDWTIDVFPNAEIGVLPDPADGQNKRLSLNFFGASQWFGNVRQYLRLPAGSYALSFDYAAPNFESPGGLHWVATCANTQANIGSGPVLTKSREPLKLAFDIQIPDTNCDTQMLQLESVSGATLDQKYQGNIWIDNLVLTKRDANQTER